MNDISIESEGGFVVSTEQWNSDLFLTISDGTDPEYEVKSILLDAPRVRKLAKWLAIWLTQHEEE